jgi:cysteine sulfinate desulfinase/cysteine desulfurase-like protein
LWRFPNELVPFAVGENVSNGRRSGLEGFGVVWSALDELFARRTHFGWWLRDRWSVNS